MAMFHFRLKSDKKPNGTYVSAVQHVDYIQREGRFKDIDQLQANNNFVGNFITTNETKDAFGGRDALLYQTDDFGSIRNSAQGIEVTENASPTTLSIALMLADETLHHQPLILNGTSNFKKAVLEAAVQADLNISFAEKRFNDEFIRRKVLIINERKRFINSGGKFIQKRSYPKPYPKFSDEETLKTLLPSEDFACLHCPNSIWFIQNHKNLACFCQTMRLVSWSTTQKNSMTLCDGMFLTSDAS